MDPFSTFTYSYWSMLAKSNREKAEEYRLSFEKKAEEVLKETVEQNKQTKPKK